MIEATTILTQGGTGLRYGEAATLRGRDLDPHDKAVVVGRRGGFVPKTKNSYRTVPVGEDFFDELLLQVGNDSSAALFPCPYDNHYPYWRCRLYRAQDRAGVTRFGFHDLRRAFAAHLRKIEPQPDVYAAIRGHSALTRLRHYSIVTEADKRQALEDAMATMRRRRDK